MSVEDPVGKIWGRDERRVAVGKMQRLSWVDQKVWWTHAGRVVQW